MRTLFDHDLHHRNRNTVQVIGTKMFKATAGVTDDVSLVYH